VFTPYDWQEGIGHRAQYIEGKLAQGSPVLAVSLDAGILVFTYRRQARKIYEIYDRLIFAGVGQQSDVEALRVAALEFASKEGFNRSEEDVTIHRVVTALSAPLKKAFSDFSNSPIVARSVFGEVGASPEDDIYYILDYDGDYRLSRKFAVVSGATKEGAHDASALTDLENLAPVEALESLKEIWTTYAAQDESESEADLREGLEPEAVLLERQDLRENRFRLLTPESF
jgi:proteasome alpha subunit